MNTQLQFAIAHMCKLEYQESINIQIYSEGLTFLHLVLHNNFVIN